MIGGAETQAHLSSLAAKRAKYEVPTEVHWPLKPYMAAMLRTCSSENHAREGVEMPILCQQGLRCLRAARKQSSCLTFAVSALHNSSRSCHCLITNRKGIGAKPHSCSLSRKSASVGAWPYHAVFGMCYEGDPEAGRTRGHCSKPTTATIPITTAM